MKIGIVTYHRSHNYGALQQAIALRIVLSDMGHSVSFVDYWPYYHRQMYALFSFGSLWRAGRIRGRFRYLKNCVMRYGPRKRRIEHFNTFISEYIEPYTSSAEEKYDVVVYGSDQIWRKQKALKTYNPVYFGKNDIQSRKHVSYAASMGLLPDDAASKNLLKGLLSHLDGISVRESGLLDLVRSLGYDGTHDLDPTLMLPAVTWESVFRLKNKPTERYALYYKLGNTFDIETVRRYADAMGLKLKIIQGSADRDDTKDVLTTADPKTFLELLHGAEFVFTSSFHGLAFSIIFHKPFLASYGKNSGRASSLLELLNLPGRLVPPNSKTLPVLGGIDYSAVEAKLSSLRKTSTGNLEALLKLE